MLNKSASNKPGKSLNAIQKHESLRLIVYITFSSAEIKLYRRIIRFIHRVKLPQHPLKMWHTARDVCHNSPLRVGAKNNSSCSLLRVGAQQFQGFPLKWQLLLTCNISGKTVMHLGSRMSP